VNFTPVIVSKIKYSFCRTIFLLIVSTCLISCSEDRISEWSFKQLIPLQGIAPVGIAIEDQYIWLSDPDRKRVLKTDLEGNILEQITNLQRPMHIAFYDKKLYIPEYLNDSIKVFEMDRDTILNVLTSLNAPAGIAVGKNAVVIADFYNHRVILIEGRKEIVIGGEGHVPGKLYYPTDVEIDNELIYVADAYNNRVQVFDKSGNSVRMIGERDNIQVAMGMTITTEEVVIADFEGNRVLVYDKTGVLKQELKEGISKPSDVVANHRQIFIASYAGNSIVVYEKREMN
jgi:NHL repeat